MFAPNHKDTCIYVHVYARGRGSQSQKGRALICCWPQDIYTCTHTCIYLFVYVYTRKRERYTQIHTHKGRERESERGKKPMEAGQVVAHELPGQWTFFLHARPARVPLEHVKSGSRHIPHASIRCVPLTCRAQSKHALAPPHT